MSIEKQILYLLSKVDQMEGKEIIKIYESMNYLPQTVRNTFTKLKKEHYIVATDRSTYRITPTGQKSIESLYSKVNYYNQTWDEKWYMVLTEIPETNRKKRDAFRKGLIELGFGQLYKSVYINPWNKTEAVIHLIDTLEIDPYVTMLVTNQFILNDIGTIGSRGTNISTNIWNINEIDLLYKERLEWFYNEIEPKVDKYTKDPSRHSLELFICYLKMIEAMDDLLTLDPMLPPQFVPPNWVGTIAISTFEKTLVKIKNNIDNDSAYSPFLQEGEQAF
ncbi:PaaX family transcriptional regulator C-terminal domain-containing protein [Bacillus sp. 31A1R]|uniref:PaaX family transcriptional regulator C-terminal domain-containing protein n=1 Tax=Robertmurraya mangrovi TaxID=3098077 RepID=A0ABU5J3W2_9BACI|nr:PaaX family transcriptional regulator C-terminal domain-containing protein [Bacillus sp. 31A1R]MDZ5474084.1 PaaX family transcriptional regulator C-terminal domain-containing protein [Bacillus sp. 31A1R]